jgi:hypothetical protein
MAGVVHIPWYATLFRGDRVEAALAEIAPVALRYGASAYSVTRNLDDRYKFLQTATFDSKSDWERYWFGPEFTHMRAAIQSYYQVPLLYSWNDIIAEGTMDQNGSTSAAAPAGAYGDTL